MYLHIDDISNGILFSPRKEKILPFETMWMGLEYILLTVIGQTEKEKYRMISHRNREYAGGCQGQG